MNQLTAHQILHRLLQYKSRVASDKMAVRWLLASLMSNAKDYDLFFRLQILEGAFGVREGVWWTKGRAGLSGAKEAAAGTAIDPEWLEPGNTGMFKILFNKVENFIKGHGVNTGADDIIQAALMGLKKNLGPKKKKGYEAGRVNSKKILSGKESPKEIAAGVLSKWVLDDVVTEAVNNKQMTYNKDRNKDQAIFKQRKHIQEDATPTGAIPDHNRQDLKSYKFLTRIILDKMNDPAGKKIRDYMRKSWSGTGTEYLMDTWLDAVERGKILQKQELSAQSGISPASLLKPWRKAWKKFFVDLRRNTALVTYLDKYFLSKGLEFPRLDLTDADSIIPLKYKMK